MTPIHMEWAEGAATPTAPESRTPINEHDLRTIILGIAALGLLIFAYIANCRGDSATAIACTAGSILFSSQIRDAGMVGVVSARERRAQRIRDHACRLLAAGRPGVVRQPDNRRIQPRTSPRPAPGHEVRNNP